MAKLSVSVDVKNLELFSDMMQCFRNVLDDERVPESLRNEAKEKVAAILDKHEKEDSQ